MDCSGGIRCLGMYLGSQLHFFAGRFGDSTQMVSTSYYPGSSSTMGPLKCWDTGGTFKL